MPTASFPENCGHGPYSRALAWLIVMARTPGWKEYAWSRAKELDRETLFAGIAKALTSAMTGQAETAESERQTRTRHY